MSDLASIRRALVSARAEERIQADRLREETARAEQRAIEAAAADGRDYGRNAEDRKRFLRLALADDERYLAVRDAERAAELEVERLEAELECLLDEHRERRLRALERLADAGLADAAALRSL